MQFELFHLSLVPKANLFSAKEATGDIPSRESWIKTSFSKKIEFPHRREVYHFIPVDQKIGGSESLLIGRIGRKVSYDENTPPEQGLEDLRRDGWKACSIIIDPRKHEDGQKIAMQVRTGLGAPSSVLRSLMIFLSENVFDSPYIFEIRPLTDASGFWDFVTENEGQITSITLEFIAPNMFGIGDDMDREWESLRANEKAVRATTKIENEHGLNPRTPRVRKAVEYASKGGGSVSARTRTGKRYNSRRKSKKVIIPEKDKQAKKSIVEIIRAAISSIFLR